MEIRVPQEFPDTADVRGLRVVLTGASRGLGYVLAHAFARAGARLLVAARDEARLTSLCDQLPGDHLPMAVDVSTEDGNAALVQVAHDRLGGLDVWIGNAGISPVFERVKTLSPQAWREIIDINLTGAFLGARAAAMGMADGGSIILTTSVLAERPMANLAPYSVSKAGIEALVRSLAAELADDGVRVNAVAPGWFNSPLTEGFMRNGRLNEEILEHTAQHRWGEPAELAGAYLFLASPAASFVTGTTVVVDGGYLCV